MKDQLVGNSKGMDTEDNDKGKLENGKVNYPNSSHSFYFVKEIPNLGTEMVPIQHLIN
jgi:hypothetical protein